VTAAASASSAILASYTASASNSAALASASSLPSSTAAGVAFSSYVLIPSPSVNSTVPASTSSAIGVLATPSVSSNGSVATPVLSTSTYFQTDVITITSCAPTVTNCPARTSTTVYPVETVITSSAQGVAAASSSVVLTYTLGAGTSTTVITTSKFSSCRVSMYALSQKADSIL
jgi:hypothetical protein